MNTSMRGLLRCRSRIGYESAVKTRGGRFAAGYAPSSGRNRRADAREGVRGARYCSQGLNGFTAYWMTRYGVPPRAMVFHWLMKTRT